MSVLNLRRQAMPGAGGDLHLRSSELLALPLHDFVEPDIVLEGIDARDVVVVLILQTCHQSSGLVYPSRDRFKLDSDLDVLRGDLLVDAEREAVVCRRGRTCRHPPEVSHRELRHTPKPTTNTGKNHRVMMYGSPLRKTIQEASALSY